MQVNFNGDNVTITRTDFVDLLLKDDEQTRQITNLYADNSDLRIKNDTTEIRLRTAEYALETDAIRMKEQDNILARMDSDYAALEQQFNESQANVIRLGMLNDRLQDQLNALIAEKESRATIVTVLDKAHRFADDQKLTAIERDLLIAIFDHNKIKGIARYRSELKCLWREAHIKANTLQHAFMATDETITIPVHRRRASR